MLQSLFSTTNFVSLIDFQVREYGKDGVKLVSGLSFRLPWKAGVRFLPMLKIDREMSIYGSQKRLIASLFVLMSAVCGLSGQVPGDPPDVTPGPPPTTTPPAPPDTPPMTGPFLLLEGIQVSTEPNGSGGYRLVVNFTPKAESVGYFEYSTDLDSWSPLSAPTERDGSQLTRKINLTEDTVFVRYVQP